MCSQISFRVPCVLLTLIATHSCGVAGATEIVVIQGEIEAYADSVHTISGRCRWTVTPPPHLVADPNTHPYENHTAAIDFEMDPRGKRTRLEILRQWQYSAYSDDPFVIRSLIVCDGVQAFRLYHTYLQDPVDVGLPVDVPYRLSASNRDRLWNGLEPREISGLLVPWVRMPLRDVLRRKDVHVMGSSLVGDRECVKVEMPDGGSILVLHLDPSRGFLPRRMEHVKVDEPRKPPNLNRSVIDITGFKQFPLPDGGELWFPTAARMRTWLDTRETLHIEELWINAPLSMDRFQVDVASLPAGVRLPKADGKARVSGGEEGRRIANEISRLHTEHSKRLESVLGPPAPERRVATSATGSVPTESTGSRWTWWLAGTGLIVLIACGVARIVQSRVKLTGALDPANEAPDTDD